METGLMNMDNSVVIAGGGGIRWLKGNIKKYNKALDGVAQWIEYRPENQSVTSLIPSQGTSLGCGPGPQ